MARIDSAFGRLTATWDVLVRKGEVRRGAVEHWRGLIDPPTSAQSAWPSSFPTSTPAARPAARQAAAASTAMAGPLVMLATAQPDLLQPIGSREPALQLMSSIESNDIFRCVPVTPSTPASLERSLTKLQPRLLVIADELVQALGVDALRELHRRAPATDWLLLCGEPSSAALETAVRLHMRGCVEWGSSDEHVQQALYAVMKGEVWLPRRVMQSLYLSLLAATQTEGTSGPMPLDEPAVPARAAQHDLTEREIEVLQLMRQGLSNKQIGERLDISINTVKKHLAHAFEKRGLHNRRQAIG